MNKRLVLFVILIAAFVLSAVNPWPAVLTVWNLTGDNVYIRLKYCGEQKYFLTATGDSCAQPTTFDIARKKYSTEVTACGVTATGSMDLRTNLKLTFTDCDSMRQFWTPKYWGEPGMEKPNFYQHWDTAKYVWVESAPDVFMKIGDHDLLGWENWQFKYSLPESYEKSATINWYWLLP